MIKVTQGDSGKPCYLDPSSITEVTELAAYSCELIGTEGGERTRIITKSGSVYLVTESALEVVEAMKTGH